MCVHGWHHVIIISNLATKPLIFMRNVPMIREHFMTSDHPFYRPRSALDRGWKSAMAKVDSSEHAVDDDAVGRE